MYNYFESPESIILPLKPLTSSLQFSNETCNGGSRFTLIRVLFTRLRKRGSLRSISPHGNFSFNNDDKNPQ